MTTEEQIEEILMEASAYGLRIEVMETAREYLAAGFDKVLSYEMAFDEWVK